jgi:hypothetical protein
MVISPWAVVLVILILFAFGGWSYGRWGHPGPEPWAYGGPSGLLGLVLLIVLILVLMRAF